MYLSELVGFWYQSAKIILVFDLVTLVSKKGTEKSVSYFMVKAKCGSKELNVCKISSALPDGREITISSRYILVDKSKNNLGML